MLAMGPRDLNSAPCSPVHCSSHSMTIFQSSELTELPVVENSQLFAQRAHSTRYAPMHCRTNREEKKECMMNPPPPPPCKSNSECQTMARVELGPKQSNNSNARVRPTAGLSATVGSLSYVAFGKYAPVSEQRSVLFPSKFGTLVSHPDSKEGQGGHPERSMRRLMHAHGSAEM